MVTVLENKQTKKENKIKTLIKVQSPNEFQTKTIFSHSTFYTEIYLTFFLKQWK